MYKIKMHINHICNCRYHWHQHDTQDGAQSKEGKAKRAKQREGKAKSDAPKINTKIQKMSKKQTILNSLSNLANEYEAVLTTKHINSNTF